MKIREAIQNVDKSDPQWVDDEPLHEALRITAHRGLPDDFDARVIGYWLEKWMCTDTWVGIQVVYFDGKPVCITEQSVRKNDKQVRFVSIEAAKELRDYMQSRNGDDFDLITDLDEEIGETYQVDYAEQLLAKEVLYQGHLMAVVKTWNKSDMVDLRNAAGFEQSVHVRKLEIPYHVTRDTP